MNGSFEYFSEGELNNSRVARCPPRERSFRRAHITERAFGERCATASASHHVSDPPRASRSIFPRFAEKSGPHRARKNNFVFVFYKVVQTGRVLRIALYRNMLQDERMTWHSLADCDVLKQLFLFRGQPNGLVEFSPGQRPGDKTTHNKSQPVGLLEYHE